MLSLASRACRTRLPHSSRASNYRFAPTTSIRTMSTEAAKYLCVHVFIKVKPGTAEAFRKASLENARNSALEEGVARFDVLQDRADPNQFILVEVYKTQDAPAKHKETAHYQAWRDTVADMMAEPRSARKFDNLFPLTTNGWDYQGTLE